MRKILGLLVLISAGVALGQEMDTLAVDTVKKTPNYIGGAYIDVGIKLAPNPPGINQTDFFGGGIQYNRWSFGFLINNFKGTTERFLIFPNAFELKYRYGGPYVSFNFIRSKWIGVDAQASFSKGDMTWRNMEDEEDFLRSEFNLLSFAAKFEMVRLRFLKPYINVGYQQMNNLSLQGVENEEFSGLFFGVGVRLGYFNQ